MIVKCNGIQVEREITVSDVIMYNGKCYQIITQKIDDGCLMGPYSPVIMAGEAKKLIEDGMLILVATRKEPIFKEITLDFYMLKEAR